MQHATTSYYVPVFSCETSKGESGSDKWQLISQVFCFKEIMILISSKNCYVVTVTELAVHLRSFCHAASTTVHVPALMLQNTVPRDAAEKTPSRQVNRTAVKKPVKKLLKMIAEIVNVGGTATLVSICDHIHKLCMVRGADNAALVQHIRLACQHAVKKGYLAADGKVFSLTDAGNKLLNLSQNATSTSVNLLLDKLLAEKVVTALPVFHSL